MYGKNIFQENGPKKHTEETILILDKIYFKKLTRRNRELTYSSKNIHDSFIMYVPINWAPKFAKEQLLQFKSHTDHHPLKRENSIPQETGHPANK